MLRVLRAQHLRLVCLGDLDDAEQSRRHLHQVLAFLLCLVERPLVVRFGAMDDRRGVRAVRGDGDEGQDDADDAHHHAHALGEGIAAMLVGGMDLDFSHRWFPR
ncbi:MAG TPA: hypothetical protein VGV09_20655 [Steroidobacteraceae bacterium]|nr:hypothetical protein [Steroidobacteraceae bacterium]